MRRSTGLQRPVRWCGTLGGAAFHEPVYQVARPQSAHVAQRFQCILPVSLLVFFWLWSSTKSLFADTLKVGYRWPGMSAAGREHCSWRRTATADAADERCVSRSRAA